MKRIIRLTESDLTRIVKRVILEQTTGGVGVSGWSKIEFGQDNINDCLKTLEDTEKPQACKGTTIDSIKCYEALKQVVDAYTCVSKKLGMNK